MSVICLQIVCIGNCIFVGKIIGNSFKQKNCETVVYDFNSTVDFFLRLGDRTRIRKCHDKVGAAIRELILKFDL